MTFEHLLIIGLSLITIGLTILLIIQRRKSREGRLSGISIEQFGLFLKTNSTDGSIQEVAGQVSQLLISACGCERILFLRKKRGILDLNYHYGLKDFDRFDLRVPFSARLSKFVSEDFSPRKASLLKDLVPDKVIKQLERFNLDLFFPVFWKENLYGLYFVKTDSRSSDKSIGLLVATLAKQLSAAYHIKWHEAKLNDFHNRLEGISTPVKSRVAKGIDLLQFLHVRKSDELIVTLVENIRKNLNLKRIAFLYQPRNGERPALIVKGESHTTLKIPPAESFESIVNEASKLKSTVTIKEFIGRTQDLNGWFEQLAAFGLEHISVFPLSEKRSGLLAWTADSPARVMRQIEAIRDHVSLLTSNAEGFETIEEMSYTDPLTSLSNQRYFRKRLDEEIGRCRRYGRKLALVIFDLDDLKSTNDQYGHLAGDDLLVQMGQILRQSTRSIDVVARYGGDEFCVIMPESDLSTCEMFMDRLRVTVGSSDFKAEGAEGYVRCTISLGGAVFPDHAEQPKKLIYAADMALLQAKESGRNQSRLFDPDLSQSSSESR